MFVQIHTFSPQHKKAEHKSQLGSQCKRTLGNSVAFSISPRNKYAIIFIFFRTIIDTSSTTLPVSSLLLLMNPPNTFAFIPLPAMSLSSLNRSNSKVFCHIMPYSAPVCEGMHYNKTGVPWQMKSILIIVFFLLKCRKMPNFADFFEVSRLSHFCTDS